MSLPRFQLYDLCLVECITIRDETELESADKIHRLSKKENA